MTPFSRDEQVWLQAYCAAIQGEYSKMETYADECLEHFKHRFPTEPTPEAKYLNEAVDAWQDELIKPTPQKESAGAKQETYESQLFKNGRKEFWIDGHNVVAARESSLLGLKVYAPIPPDSIYAIELRDGEVIVNREMVYNAVSKHTSTSWVSKKVAKTICDELGLK